MLFYGRKVQQALTTSKGEPEHDYEQADRQTDKTSH